MGYNSVVLADSPAGYWRLGERSGTVATDQTGNANGTYVNNPTLGIPSLTADMNDTAITTVGGGAGVTLPNVSALNLSSSVSLECWLRTSTGTPEADIIQGFDLSLFKGYGLMVGRAGTGLVSYYCDKRELATTQRIDDGNVHHIVATATATSATIYVDGAASVTASADYTPSASATTRALATRTNQANSYAGDLDEVAIYNSALSADRVLAHYHQGPISLTVAVVGTLTLTPTASGSLTLTPL